MGPAIFVVFTALAYIGTYEYIATKVKPEWWTISELTWWVTDQHQWVGWLIMGFFVILILHLRFGLWGKKTL